MTEETKPDADKAPAPPTVRGFTEQDYINWRHHPVTRDLFLRYLRDYRADIIGTVSENWVERPLDQQTDHEARGRVKTLAELADLPFDAIVLFYEQKRAADAAKPKPTNEEDDDDAA